MAIELEELVHAVASGALRALKARDMADPKAAGIKVPGDGTDSSNPFFVDLRFRCGIPPYIEAAKLASEVEAEE